MASTFHDVMAAGALAEGEFRTTSAGAWQILLACVQGETRAIENRCSHAASRFDGGRIRGQTIACPLHGARFDTATGRCVGGAYPAIRAFEVIVRDGRVLVGVPKDPPGTGGLPGLAR